MLTHRLHFLVYFQRFLFSACLQIGVKTWAKTSSGEYCLGKVVSMTDQISIQFDDEKIISYDRSENNELVPDIIPGPEDVAVGIRVIAQWLHRDTLYPGVVSSVRSDDDYEITFDDGDTGNVKAFQIRLIRPYVSRSE